MTRFLVTGVSGLLGLNFALAVDGKTHQVTGVANTRPMPWASFTNVKADLTHPGIVENLIETHKPEVLVHCAAMANVDACEAQPEQAALVNAELPGVIAAACRKHSLRLIHISTDAVFDGKTGNYSEEDTPNPLGVYARTKLDGEMAVLSTNPDALVVRVNFYGWSAAGNRSLAESFVNNLADGKGMMGFTDIHFSTLNVLDLSALLVEVSALDLHGVYHMVGAQAMSKYQFGIKIAEKFGFDPSLIRPVSIHESGLKATRSPNLTLYTDKLRAALHHELPEFGMGLQKFYDQYRHGYPEYLKSLVLPT